MASIAMYCSASSKVLLADHLYLIGYNVCLNKLTLQVEKREGF